MTLETSTYSRARFALIAPTRLMSESLTCSSILAAGIAVLAESSLRASGVAARAIIWSKVTMPSARQALHVGQVHADER